MTTWPFSSRPKASVLLALGVLVLLAGCVGTLQTPGSVEHPSPDIDFEEVTNESGLQYVDAVGSQTGVGNASVYAADVDRDGWTDVLTSGDGKTALWHNENGTFERVENFPQGEGPVKSATFVDYDGDGWEDIILFPEYGPATALHNENGTFEPDEIGLGEYEYPLGGAAADYDSDGDEDLLLYQSGNWREGKPAGYLYINGTIRDDNGKANYLYENVGGEYERVENSGIEGTRWSLAASFVDLNGDDLPDIHVANDYNTDVLYFNQGNGTFEQRFMRGNTARNGMASEMSDFDRDGRIDAFVTNIDIPLSKETVGKERYETYKRLFSYVIHSSRTKGNTLMLNQGNGQFNDSAKAYGIQTGGWGWAASHVDFNNDGQRDLFHNTQNIVNVHLDDHVYTYPMVFQRTGDNFTQLDASEIGLKEDDGRGMISVDYDRDGQMEVISANYVEQYSVYDNTANATDTNAIEFLAVDGNGAAAYGATIEVDAGYASRTVFQHSRTDYLSQEPRESHVGLGSKESATLTVTWPDGTERTFEDVSAGQYVHLRKNGSVETVVEFDG